MPNQAHSGARGVPWSRCMRCGFDYPTDQLVIQPGIRHGGIIVCIEKCADKPYPQEYRDEIIQQNLESTPEEMQVADILRTPPNPDNEIIP